MLFFTKSLITTIIDITIGKYVISVLITKKNETKIIIQLFFKIKKYINYEKLNFKIKQFITLLWKRKIMLLKEHVFVLLKTKPYT